MRVKFGLFPSSRRASVTGPSLPWWRSPGWRRPRAPPQAQREAASGGSFKLFSKLGLRVRAAVARFRAWVSGDTSSALPSLVRVRAVEADNPTARPGTLQLERTSDFKAGSSAATGATVTVERGLDDFDALVDAIKRNLPDDVFKGSIDAVRKHYTSERGPRQLQQFLALAGAITEVAATPAFRAFTDWNAWHLLSAAPRLTIERGRDVQTGGTTRGTYAFYITHEGNKYFLVSLTYSQLATLRDRLHRAGMLSHREMAAFPPRHAYWVLPQRSADAKVVERRLNGLRQWFMRIMAKPEVVRHRAIRDTLCLDINLARIRPEQRALALDPRRVVTEMTVAPEAPFGFEEFIIAFTLSDGTQWAVTRRFSDFVRLRKALQSSRDDGCWYPTLPVAWPPCIVPRSIAADTRIVPLTQWLVEVCTDVASSGNPAACAAFTQFLQFPDHRGRQSKAALMSLAGAVFVSEQV